MVAFLPGILPHVLDSLVSIKTLLNKNYDFYMYVHAYKYINKYIHAYI